MAENSKIEWTDHTINLWWGCTKVHEGCDNCYAEALANRFKNNVWGNDAPRRIIKSAFHDLRKLQKRAESKYEIQKVFVGSMMDIFEKPMQLIDAEKNKILLNESKTPMTTGDLRYKLFCHIHNGYYPNLIFLFLTKRPSNINKYILEDWKLNPPKNVVFGTSIVNQSTSDNLVKQLLQVNGKKFLSIEPQLDIIEKIDLNDISWVIQGGESGDKRRPFNLQWTFPIREICKKHKVPYFFKQIDKVTPIPSEFLIREEPSF